MSIYNTQSAGTQCECLRIDVLCGRLFPSSFSFCWPLRSLSRVASDYSSDSVVCLGSSASSASFIIAFCFFTQSTQRAQRFILIRVSRLRWSGRKLRYDKRAQRVLSTPSALRARPPVSGGQSVWCGDSRLRLTPPPAWGLRGSVPPRRPGRSRGGRGG